MQAQNRRNVMANEENVRSAAAHVPVELIDTGSRSPQPQPGMALCLSGGGYRAMMFHVGALWRLNEVGLLGKLARISSVSGGSIAAGYLGLRWNDLAFDQGKAAKFGLFVDGMRAMADTTVDVGAIIGGIFLRGTISE